jgi:hypothetical protein
MIKTLTSKNKPLTKRKKESTMRDDGVMSFLGVRDLSRRFKKIFSRSLRSLLVFVSRQLPLKGRKVKVTAMVKKVFASKWGKFAVALAALALVAACGGGGDSAPAPGVNPPPQPVSVTKTVTCPNGSPQSATAATADAAISAAAALCAQSKLISVTPANGTTGVNLDGTSTFNVAVATDSVLMATASGDVTLKAGQTQVPGTVVAVGDKGFKFTPSAKLLYGQTYAFVANLKDALGRALAVNSTFTTASVACVSPKIPSSDGQSCVNPTCTAPAVWSGTSCEIPPAPVCTAPAMANSSGTCVSPPAGTGYTWNNVIKAWVADIGTLVVGLNTLPAECVTIGDACWKASTANGTIKYFGTNLALTGFSNRKVVFAGFIIGGSGFGSGNFNMIPIYLDSEAESPYINKMIVNASYTDGFVNARGSQDGVKFTLPLGICGEFFFNGNGIASHSASCPI